MPVIDNNVFSIFDLSEPCTSLRAHAREVLLCGNVLTVSLKSFSITERFKASLFFSYGLHYFRTLETYLT